jgi:hypothetical protein
MATSFNIADTVKLGLDIAFTVAGDLTRSATFYRVTNYQWNSTTGALDPITTTKTCTLFVLPYRPDQINGIDILQGDERVLIRASELTSITPATGDYVIETGGTRRNLKAVFLDPSTKLYEFQSRVEALDAPQIQAGTVLIDFGNLNPLDEAEGYGDLAAFFDIDDWGKLA